MENYALIKNSKFHGGVEKIAAGAIGSLERDRDTLRTNTGMHAKKLS